MVLHWRDHWAKKFNWIQCLNTVVDRLIFVLVMTDCYKKSVEKGRAIFSERLESVLFCNEWVLILLMLFLMRE